jgi:DNA-binding XRE family transcriptional regulator
MGRKPKDQEEQILNRIEALRQEAGLSRQDLADAVGVHYQTVGYIERGEYSPSLVLAFRIAKALNKPVEQIFTLEDDHEEGN